MGFGLIVISVFANSNESKIEASAVFAGGCFWCMEPPFDKLDGVVLTTSGYIGGLAENAHYKKVSAGTTQHVEAIKVDYDPSKVSYAELLQVFWKNVDPFDDRGQFCDKGAQYLSYIYVGGEEEAKLADQSLAQIKQRFAQSMPSKAVATKVVSRTAFFPAEQYHQDYYQRNPIRYKFYRGRCGRDKRLKALWGG